MRRPKPKPNPLRPARPPPARSPERMSDVWAPAPAAVPRRKERWWLHGLLLLLTLATTSWAGAGFAINFRPSLLGTGASAEVFAHLLEGALSFSLPLLAILVAHEAGHYLMCRRYGIDASPPYFIPFPSLVGTMGAFIRIREPFRTKTHLFDVGVAGPIAGFVVALPILVYGMAHTRMNPGPIEGGTLIFHYPLLVTILQK